MTHIPPPYQPFSHEADHPIVEGVSGVGKSTLASLLAARLKTSSLHTLSDPHTGWSPLIERTLRPLPQLGFYLSGLLHASDRIRQAQALGPVVADRYLSSVIACHSAVHRVSTDAVTALLAPFRPYVATPTRTYYLRCAEDAAARAAGHQDRHQERRHRPAQHP
ncbi:hypothetical protein [Streptomyces sp. NPDC005046]